MTAVHATQAGRAAAEAVMTDTCTITRGAGIRTLDRAEGVYTTEPGDAVYSGSCRVKPSGMDQPVDAGERRVSLWPYIVSVPMSATAIALDDTVTVTASTLDPSLVGKAMRVRHVDEGSHLTARRLGCEAVEL